MSTYRFVCTIRCYSYPGEGPDAVPETDVLRGYEVSIDDAYDEDDAREQLESVALEQIADQGCRTLDWPVDRIEIVRASCYESWR